MFWDGKDYEQVSKERWILAKTNLINWRGKTLDEMSDQECIDCLRYIYNMTGTSYYTSGGDTQNLWLEKRKPSTNSVKKP
jgi:hypothetical protein